MRSEPQVFGAGMPPMRPWVRYLLGGLFVLYVVELIAKNAWGGIYALLPWYSFEAGFQPWQLVTHYLVQGPGVLGVMFGLLALFFSLPMLDMMLTTRQLAQAAVAAFVGGAVIGTLFDLVGIAGDVAMGWGPLAISAFALFGLANPTSEIRVFFVLPVRGIMFAWGTGIVTVLMLLATRDLGAADAMGAWVGVVGWWFLLGPGARRRKLVSQKKNIEKELSKFQVIQGGRNGDDIVH